MRLRLAVLCPMLASALLITPVQRPAVRLALSATPRSAAPVLALPTTATLVATSTIPTLLGFYKSEYGVSYAYGAAMAAAGAMHLSAASPLAAAHAFVVLACAPAPCPWLRAMPDGRLRRAADGVRLNLFLLYRELAIPRFRAFREKIEERAVSRGGRLARTPFVLSCSMLYFCMASPVLLTARYAPAAGTAAASALAGLVGLMALGFGVAAVGDLSKTWLKVATPPQSPPPPRHCRRRHRHRARYPPPPSLLATATRHAAVASPRLNHATPPLGPRLCSRSWGRIIWSPRGSSAGSATPTTRASSSSGRPTRRRRRRRWRARRWGRSPRREPPPVPY